MIGINRKLSLLERDGTFIRVGVIGAGQMGRGMVAQIHGMKGMRVVAIADLRAELCWSAYRNARVRETDIREVHDRDEADKLVRKGHVVVTTDAILVTHMGEMDVIVDATGMTNIGAQIAWNAISNRKHVVMLNVETDVTVGPLLKKLADAAGVVYTGAAGDEPAAIMELYDFATALGFEVTALGKGKNNPLNVHANPETVAQEALPKKMNPKMLASFQDGTKTMVEMTAVCNATGFEPDIHGMHGPRAEVNELANLLRRKQDGGMLNRLGVVEYINGIAPGVFAVFTSDMPEVHAELQYLKLGNGPQYVLYRPYHLTSLETPISIARSYFYHEPTIAPYYGHVAETVAVAKRTLKVGEALDGIGGFTCYGRIMSAKDANQVAGLPIGLIGPNVRMKRTVQTGDVITYDDIEFTSSTTILELRNLMMTAGLTPTSVQPSEQKLNLSAD